MKRIEMTINFNGSKIFCGQKEYDWLAATKSALYRASTKIFSSPFGKACEGVSTKVSFSVEDMLFSEEIARNPEFYLAEYSEYFINGDVHQLSDEAPECLPASEGGETTVNAWGRVEAAFNVNFSEYGGDLDAEEIEEIIFDTARREYEEIVGDLCRNFQVVDTDDFDVFDVVFNNAKIIDVQ